MVMAVKPFTPREQEVVALLLTGETFAEIAARLGVTTRTVKAHSDAIRGKLGVNRRWDIARALEAQHDQPVRRKP